MAPARKPSLLPKPHTTIDNGRGTLRFYLARLSRRASARCLTRRVSAIVTSPPYNLGIRLPQLRRHPAARPSISTWTGPGSRPRARALEPAGLAVPERRRQADRSRGPRSTSRRPPAAHLQLQNTIHWIKSIAIDRDAAGASAGLETRPRGRPLQADQQRAVPERLPRVHLPLHAPAGARRSTGAPSASRIRTRRTSPAGRRGRRQPALPRQHLVHPLRDDPEPRQRSAASGDVSAAGAGYCLKLHGLSRVTLAMDPFLGLGSTARRRRAAWASTSSASRSTSTTSPRPLPAPRRALESAAEGTRRVPSEEVQVKKERPGCPRGPGPARFRRRMA